MAESSHSEFQNRILVFGNTCGTKLPKKGTGSINIVSTSAVLIGRSCFPKARTAFHLKLPTCHHLDVSSLLAPAAFEAVAAVVAVAA